MRRSARPNPSSNRRSSEQRLKAALDRLLGTSMGGEPFRHLAADGRPISHAARIIILYGLVWIVVEGLGWAFGIPSRPELVSLLAWGGVYVTAKAFIAAHTTRRIKATVERDILPHASAEFIDSVALDFERRGSTRRSIHTPLLFALLCSAIVAAVFVVYLDAGLADAGSPEALFGTAVLFSGFFVSARSASAAGFYISFAERLENEPPQRFFVLGAAASPLVRGLSKLGTEVLAFWTCIFLAILSSMLLALPWPGGFGIELNSPFLLLPVSVASFVTLGIGSLFYLRTEAKIRSALRRVTLSQAAILQQKINALLDPLAGRVPSDPAEVAKLSEWHDRILDGGHYGSRAGTAVSIALPFAMPVVSLVSKFVQ